MRSIFKFLLPALICFSAACLAATDPAADFNSLVDKYFDFHFEFNPTEATQAGFHQYDSKLEDYSAAGRKREIAGLKDYLAKFERLDRSSLPPDTAGDLAWMISANHSQLLELESVQMWRKDPDGYTSGVTNSIFLLMKRNFAPPEERLRSVIDRERQFPKAFEAARQNLKDPARIYTEIALEQLPDVIDFYRKDVPEVFSQVKDPKLSAEFKTSNQAAIADLESYQKFLHDTVLPHANGDFRLGADNYRKKLLYDEMVDIPLDRLLEIGFADLRRNQARLKEVAAQIDTKHTPAEVLANLRKDHPQPDQLLQTFRDTLGGLRQFLKKKKIIKLPSAVP